MIPPNLREGEVDARFWGVVAGGAILASFTDWLFMGVLFHEKYLLAPEVWRQHPQLTGARRIVYSQLLGVLTCAAFAYLCLTLDALGWTSALTVAVLVWLAGVVAIWGQMAIWMKLHPLLALSHSLGWLARLLITAVLAVLLLGGRVDLAPTAV